MKVVHLSTFDIQGGAARAAYRLHTALRKIGVDSRMLVYTKMSDDPTVTELKPEGRIGRVFYRLRPYLDQLPLKRYKNREKVIFSPAWVPFSGVVKKIESIDPDIVHLHWICGGMLRIEDLKGIKKPVIWSLHDSWAFTGGCHYNEECVGYKGECGCCKVLGSAKENDLSKKVFKRKHTALRRKEMVVVGLSRWLSDCAKNSVLLKNKRHINLPNPLNTNVFKPFDKAKARDLWNLPKGKELILFGAMGATFDHRKGFKKLSEALHNLISGNVEFVLFGSKQKNDLDKLSIKLHCLGFLHDDVSLITLYGAVDVTVVPSLQENLSNIIMESLACGTPVVAFDVGGNSDLVDHKVNGYLARPYDSKDLANGIEWVLQNPDYDSLCRKAREKVVKNFDSKIVAAKYLKLYEEIVNGS